MSDDDIFNSLIEESRKPPPKVAAAIDEYLPVATDAMLDQIEDQIDAILCKHESKIPTTLASDDGKTLLKMIAAQFRAMREERTDMQRTIDIAVMQASMVHRIELSCYKRAILKLLDNDHELAASLGSTIAALANTSTRRSHA